MKRGKGEEKVMGPMFPRLHVNDTEKGGPRAPPRNKMALYEQLSIPSQRFNPGDLPLNSNNTANVVPPYSSQGNEHERSVVSSRQLPALGHPVEKPHGRNSGSNTPLREVKSKKQTEKEDFRVPTFGNSKVDQGHGKFYNNMDMEKLAPFNQSFSGCSNKELKEITGLITRQHGKSQNGETNIVRLEFRSDSQVDCTVFSGSVMDVDNDSQEDKACKSSQTGEMGQCDDLSETSMVECLSEMDISPDDVVRIIGQKHFWKARRAIANQQRMLAVQIFELHRLLKVQKLIARSPNGMLEDSAACLGKPLKKLSDKRISLEYCVEAPENVSKSKNDTVKPKSRMECNAENNVGKTSPSSVQNGTLPPPENPPPTPVKYDSLMSPWCFNQPRGHQWLIPVMSPSEGLVYKPVYGGCGPQGLTPVTRNFSAPSYGLPFAPPNGHGYFRPFGMPVMNPAIPSPGATGSQGQLSVGRANFNIQHQNSSNVESENDGTVPEVVRLSHSRDSELQASTANSPSERARGVDMCNSSPAIDNPVCRPQPRFPNHPARVIKVVPHNARSATESAAQIFQSIQEERKQY
ncbi:protein HEADING DATE 3B-like isoform X1 [Lycium ferocissimum]|uniref:protein HEADING DATE 3B-like isoform X1 n=1 Tax=Lycium ferocissimum TaxID=112874 RepID=UPI0028165D51|nr:protein HEADING DATE 3B-like isoform X1 [Lycium ferocissimum]